MVGFKHAALTHGALRSYGQGLPGLRIFSPLPWAIRSCLAWMLAYRPCFLAGMAAPSRLVSTHRSAPGSEGAPTAEAFEEAAKTEKGKAAKAPKKQAKRR